MSDQYVIHCPGPACSVKCKSLQGLAQHISHRTVCAQAAQPLLTGISLPVSHPILHHTSTNLEKRSFKEDIDPLWPQEDDNAPNVDEPAIAWAVH